MLVIILIKFDTGRKNQNTIDINTSLNIINALISEKLGIDTVPVVNNWKRIIIKIKFDFRWPFNILEH